MLFVPAIVRKINPSTVVGSKWKVISSTFQNFSSSAGFSPEELERFRKVFRTVPSYEESISSKDYPAYLQSINFIKPKETYQKYIEFIDKVLGGRIELNQAIKYIRNAHDPRLLVNEYLITFDQDNDGYVSKEEYELGMETLRAHDPSVRNISYEIFLKEADANNDGKISVSECHDWLDKNLKPAL